MVGGEARKRKRKETVCSPWLKWMKEKQIICHRNMRKKPNRTLSIVSGLLFRQTPMDIICTIIVNIDNLTMHFLFVICVNCSKKLKSIWRFYADMRNSSKNKRNENNVRQGWIVTQIVWNEEFLFGLNKTEWFGMLDWLLGIEYLASDFNGIQKHIVP